MAETYQFKCHQTQHFANFSFNDDFFKATWSTNLAQNFLSIDFEAVKSSFSLALTLTKIIYRSSAGATVV
jgi:hypothetical protein